MSTGSDDVDEIRRQMAKVRRELHADVQHVVTTANAATDWRSYITAYPWLTLGGAAVAGYMIVPRRQENPSARIGVAAENDLAKIREMVAETRQAITEAAHSDVVKKIPKKGLIAAALGLAAPIALRAAQGYAMKFLESWILQQQMSHPEIGPLFVQPVPGGRSGPENLRDPRKGGFS